jgi:ankyrin repeat protein
LRSPKVKISINKPLADGKCGSALVAAVLRHGDIFAPTLFHGGYSASGTILVVNELVEAGADVNLKLDCGNFGNALIAAAAVGTEPVMAHLIDLGADMRHEGLFGSKGKYGTALAAAAFFGNVDCVTTLMQRGADVSQTLKRGDWERALDAAKAKLTAAENERAHFWSQTFMLSQGVLYKPSVDPENPTNMVISILRQILSERPEAFRNVRHRNVRHVENVEDRKRKVTKILRRANSSR